VLDVEFVPSSNLQMVLWVETAEGDYVDTVFITEATGRYGLGNRPGRMDFNSGPLWPYGRRLSVAPVWAYRHGELFPSVVFQNGDEDNLSHPLSQSSLESYYCRPLREGEQQWDTQTCASIVYTDKGRLEGTDAVYPPRSDIARGDVDHPDVDDFPTMNPFDVMSRATPPGGVPYEFVWPLPSGFEDGRYVAYLEVSKAFDFNDSYNETVFPEPVGIPWSDYGLPYRGQPSVVYRVEFEVSGEQAGVFTTDVYAGHGDPDGLTGDLTPPDGTITEGVDGTGASRILLSPADDVSDAFRLRLLTRPSNDAEAPAAPSQIEILDASPTRVRTSFIAPGNDDMTGVVAGYEVRISPTEPLTADNFETEGLIADVGVALQDGGSVQDLEIRGLSPNTRYFVGVRAFDECLNRSDIAFFEIVTERFPNGTVSACGCTATDDASASGLALLLLVAGVLLRRRKLLG